MPANSLLIAEVPWPVFAARAIASSAFTDVPDVSATPQATLDPDAGLAERARDGDLAAGEELVRRHQADVARILWRFARNHTDLDDLVQDTFLRAFRSLGQWRAERPFIHWLRRIAVNAGRDYCRREAARRRWIPIDEPSADPTVPTPDYIDPTADAADQAALGEVKDWLAVLPPDDRTLLTLHHLEGWTLVQIAAELGWTVTATKVRAWRARRRLRQHIESLSTS